MDNLLIVTALYSEMECIDQYLESIFTLENTRFFTISDSKYVEVLDDNLIISAPVKEASVIKNKYLLKKDGSSLVVLKEYSNGISTLITNIGNTNSKVAFDYINENYNGSIINVGCVGSINPILKIGDIVYPTKLLNRYNDPITLKTTNRSEKTIFTSDRFLNSEDKRQLLRLADVVDMELFYLGKLNNFVSIKVVSDTLSNSFTEFLKNFPNFIEVTYKNAIINEIKYYLENER